MDTGTGHSGFSSWYDPKTCGGSFLTMTDRAAVSRCARIDQVPMALLLGAVVGVIVGLWRKTWWVGVLSGAGAALLVYFVGVWFEVRGYDKLQTQVQQVMDTEGVDRNAAIRQLMKQSAQLAAANRQADATRSGAAMIAGALMSK